MRTYITLFIVALSQLIFAFLCDDKEANKYFFHITTANIFIVGALILHKLEKL